MSNVSRKAARLVLSAILFAWLSVPSAAGSGEKVGPFGPEGPRMREQLWMLPSGSQEIQLRATVFRPDDGPVLKVGGSSSSKRPLVIINHGTSESTRMSVSMPVYYWLSRWFVERGFNVVLPQRRGHGATAGPLAEGVGSCSEPEHHKAGNIAADDIQAVVDHMTKQPFVSADEVIVVGISTGGWASLALGARNLEQVRGIVNFAGGRGGHAWGRPNQVCGSDRLIAAAKEFGSRSLTPSLWLYSKNDSYFGPDLARNMASAFNAGGGKAELQILPAYGTDGHSLADDYAGWQLWGHHLEEFLTKVLPHHTAAPRGHSTTSAMR